MAPRSLTQMFGGMGKRMGNSLSNMDPMMLSIASQLMANSAPSTRRRSLMEGMGPAILQGQQMQRQAAERKRLEDDRRKREAAMARLPMTPRTISLLENEASQGATLLSGEKVAPYTPDVPGAVRKAQQGVFASAYPEQYGTEMAKSIFASPSYQTLAPGSSLLRNGEVVYTAPHKEDTFKLRPGEKVFGSDGREIASLDPADPTYTLSPGQILFDQEGGVIAEVDSRGFVVAAGSTLVGPGGEIQYTGPDKPETFSGTPQQYIIGGEKVVGLVGSLGTFQAVPGATLPEIPSDKRVTMRPPGMGADSSKDESFFIDDPEVRKLGKQGWTDVRIPASTTNVNITDAAAAQNAQNRARTAMVATQDIDHALDLLEKGGPGGTPLAGLFSPLQIIPGSPWKDLASTLETVRGIVGLESLTNLRKASATGAGLGTVSDWEGRTLQAVLGNLDMKQSGPQLKYNLERLRLIVQGFVDGVVDPDTGQVRKMQEGDLSPEVEFDRFGNVIDR
jgi:hypothetical protein